MKPNVLVTFFVIVAAVVALDQWTKSLVRRFVGGPHTYGHGLLTLMHAENTGAFLSLGANLPAAVRTLIFGVFVTVILVLFAIAVVKGSMTRTGDVIAAAAVIGGGIGNLIDRLTRAGNVTDFLYLEVGPLHTGIFNVADMAITFAVIWLVLTMRAPKKTSGAT